MSNQTYRIFLASSYELKEDREQFEIFINRRNNLLKDKNVFLQLVIWEDIGAEIYPSHKQDHYNKELKTCDIFVMLYWSKVGMYTNIEFDRALAQFRYTEAHPKMYVYRKTAPMPSSQTTADKQSVVVFQNKLKEIGYFDIPYNDAVELNKHFGDELDKLFNSGYLKYGSQRFENPAECLYTDGNSVPIHFIGRNEELKTIKDKLDKGGSLMLINAEGGIGKTSLAAKYWEESLYQYKYNAWLFCENGIVQAIKKLAAKLEVDLSGLNEDGQIEALKLALLDKSADFLLVLDNADKDNDIEEFKRVFRGLKWHILITSRRTGRLENQQILHINHLPPQIAKELFERNYKENTHEFDALLDRLLAAIDYHTLLVELFAKNMNHLRELGETLADFLNDLETKGLYLENKSFRIETDYVYNVHKKEGNTDAIIEILYDFSKLNEDERYLMVNLALLPAVFYNLLFVIELFATEDKFVFSGIIKGLADKGWLGHDESGYRMSPVLQSLILRKNRDNLQQDAEKLIDNLNDKLDNDGTYLTNLNYYEAASFAQLVSTITKHLEKQPFWALGFLNFNASVFYRATGDLLEAKKAIENYLTISEGRGDKHCIAVSYSHLGNIFKDLGDLEKALEFYQKYNDLEKQRNKTDPDNLNFKNGLAISYEKLGDTYTSLGSTEKALDFYQKENELFEQLHEAVSDNKNFKNGLAVSCQKLGNTHASLGDLERALELYQKYNELKKQLYEANSGNVNFKNGLAISYEKLGNTHISLGDLEKALDFYQKENELFEQLHEANTDNVNFKNGLAISYQYLGSTHASLDDTQMALEFYQKYNELEKQLHEANPANVNFKNQLAVSYQYLGITHASLDDIQMALEFYQKYNELEKQLHEANPGNVNFKNGLAASYNILGQTYIALGDPEKALDFYQKDIELSKQLHEEFPTNVNFKNGLAVSFGNIGWIYEKKGEIENAKHNYIKAINLWEELVVTSPQMVAFQKNLDNARQILNAL